MSVRHELRANGSYDSATSAAPSGDRTKTGVRRTVNSLLSRRPQSTTTRYADQCVRGQFLRNGAVSRSATLLPTESVGRRKAGRQTRERVPSLTHRRRTLRVRRVPHLGVAEHQREKSGTEREGEACERLLP